MVLLEISRRIFLRDEISLQRERCGLVSDPICNTSGPHDMFSDPAEICVLKCYIN
jgi:hypothetical protein